MVSEQIRQKEKKTQDQIWQMTTIGIACNIFNTILERKAREQKRVAHKEIRERKRLELNSEQFLQQNDETWLPIMYYAYVSL